MHDDMSLFLVTAPRSNTMQRLKNTYTMAKVATFEIITDSNGTSRILLIFKTPFLSIIEKLEFYRENSSFEFYNLDFEKLKLLYNYSDKVIDIKLPYTWRSDQKFKVLIFGDFKDDIECYVENVYLYLSDPYYKTFCNLKKKGWFWPIREFIYELPILRCNNYGSLVLWEVEYNKDEFENRESCIYKIYIIIDTNGNKDLSNFQISMFGSIIYDLPHVFTFKKHLQLNGFSDKMEFSNNIELHEIEIKPRIETRHLEMFLKFDKKCKILNILYEGYHIIDFKRCFLKKKGKEIV